MSQYGVLLLNRVIEQNDVPALRRYSVDESHFGTAAERKAYRFINDYATTNAGQAPSYATLAVEVPEFEYVPQVADKYEYLTRKLKDDAAKRAIVELFNGGPGKAAQVSEKFAELGGSDYIEWLQTELESVRIQTRVRESVGTDLKRDADKFLVEYEKRKAGESARVWNSKFSVIGQYVSGNVYTVYGKSGRGKSVITLEDAVHMADQGATVLIWAMEMGWYEVLVRIYVSISGNRGYTTARSHGMELAAGFDAAEIRQATLTDEWDVAFKAFVSSMNDMLAGNIIVRSVDDDDFYARDLRALEADIEAVKADVVVVDPFYYLDYETNTSKTTGGDAANTSKKLRHLAGRTQTVMIPITQAEEWQQGETEDGERELALPQRSDVKKTKALLEDASILIGIDTDYKQGRGLIGIGKGRNGGEGEVAEIIYIPSVGVVKELEVGEAAASQFDF